MKLNIVFLLIGIALSIASKILQFIYKNKIGDIIVIPAAIFFVLAILFSISKFTKLIDENLLQVIVLSLLACMAVICFQLMLIMLFSYQNKFGIILIVPLIISAVLFIRRWLAVFH